MIRLILFTLIIFLIARIFVVYSSGVSGEEKKRGPEDKDPKAKRGVPKGIGEYVDYEEVKKQ